MRICFIALAFVVVANGHAAATCAQQSGPDRSKPLQDAMESGRFVAYQPTELRVVDGKPTRASAASIAEDLRVLRPRFDGLITYGAHSGGESIADVASQLGFRAVIVGVWDIRNEQEILNAVSAWRRQPKLIVGLSLGNETVLGKRAEFAELVQTIQKVRRVAPGLALTTTEPFHLFQHSDARSLLAHSDYLLVNAHPIFQPWFPDAPETQAAEFVANVAREMAKIHCGPVLIKEASVPSAPSSSGYTPAIQAKFFKALHASFTPGPKRAFVYFSAFDAPWRVADAHPIPGTHPEEAHFGLFDERRKPKPVVDLIPLLAR